MAIEVYFRKINAEFASAGYIIKISDANRVIITKRLDDGWHFELVAGESGNPYQPFYHIAKGPDPLGAAFGPRLLYGPDGCPVNGSEIKNLFLASQRVVLTYNADLQKN